MLSQIIDAAMLLLGIFFIVVAAIGMLRMPDLMIRMHAATKAGTVGVGFIMLAVANHFGELGITVRALIIIVFLLVTAPVAAHLIGRSAYIVGVPLWERSKVDEMREYYDNQARENVTISELYDPVRLRAARGKAKP